MARSKNHPLGQEQGMGLAKEGVHGPSAHPSEWTGLTPWIDPQDPTTSFLTAATLIYAIGPGITAGAGTRLVLQLLLDDLFTFLSFQSQGRY